MKKKITRIGVFETNSSSAHSVSIANDKMAFVLDPIYPNELGEITLCGGEYGWEWFKTNSSIEKANYVAQQFSHNQDALDMLIDVILELTGATKVVIADLSDGYVDHQSCGIIPMDKEQIRRFIFDKNSWLFGGNDNSDEDPTFYDVPEYRVDSVKEIVYKYVLKIDGLEKETFFKKKPTQDEINQGINALIDHFPLNPDGSFDLDDSIMHKLSVDSSRQFEQSYRKKIDHKNQTIPFLRKDTWSVANDMFKQNQANKDIPWNPTGYNMVRELEQGLVDLPNSPYIIWKKYTVNKIDNGKVTSEK